MNKVGATFWLRLASKHAIKHKPKYLYDASLNQKVAPTSAGFTLLEVMIAMVIIAIGIGAILVAQNNSLDTNFRAKRMTTIAMLAKNALIEAERELEGKTFEEVREEATGKFDPPYSDFSWERKIKKITFPNLMQSLAGGAPAPEEGSSGGGVTTVDSNIENVVKIATNYLSKSSREISVTIKWKEKGEDQKFNVSQYWVDLKHEFSLSTE